MVYGTACELFYGSGTVNFQTHSIYLGITSATGIIPKGTVMTWTVCVTGGSGAGNEIPTTNYSANASWNLTLSAASGSPLASGSCFTATITFNVDYTTGAGPGGTWCAPALVWTDIFAINPAAQVTFTANAPTGPTVVSGGTASFSYTVAKRAPSAINTPGRAPTFFTSRSGNQTCYPRVSYSQLLQSDGADDVTCYPSGTNITTSRCTWTSGGTTCSASATGLCTPPFRAAVAGQLNIPAMC